jgi:hypothetical protein
MGHRATFYNGRIFRANDLPDKLYADPARGRLWWDATVNVVA